MTPDSVKQVYALLVYIFFISVIDRYVSESKEIFSHAALLLSGMSSGILIVSLITMRYGMMREYYFECAVIAIDFISLIFIGSFAAILFRHGGKTEHERKE